MKGGKIHWQRLALNIPYAYNDKKFELIKEEVLNSKIISISELKPEN
jgi:hypothetical protein